MKPLMSSLVFARHALGGRLQALRLIRGAETATALRCTRPNTSLRWLKHSAACAAQSGYPRRWRTSCLRVTQQGAPTCAG